MRRVDARSPSSWSTIDDDGGASQQALLSPGAWDAHGEWDTHGDTDADASSPRDTPVIPTRSGSGGARRRAGGGGGGGGGGALQYTHNVPRVAGIGGSIFNLSNSMLGGGISLIALPAAAREAGFVGFSMLVAVSAFMTQVSVLLLADAAVAAGGPTEPAADYGEVSTPHITPNAHPLAHVQY
jgi:hypothetical protein